MFSSLVIIAQRDDPHIKTVAELLNRNEAVNVFIIGELEEYHLDAALPDGEFTFSALNLSTHSLQVVPRPYAYWWRAKRYLVFAENESYQRRLHKRSELIAAIQADIEVNSIFNFNDYRNVYTHENKPLQLKLAVSVGFSVPQGRVTSNKMALLQWMQKDGKYCAKSLGSPFVYPTRSDALSGLNILSHVVTRDMIADCADEEINQFPFLIQEYIEKRHEIRLIAFSDACQSYLVDSQNSALGKEDWRRAQLEPIYTPTETPDSIREMTSKYLSVAGLQYGVFDFIVTPDNRWVFLECNSDGQWAWLERDQPPLVSEIFASGISRLLSWR